MSENTIYEEKQLKHMTPEKVMEIAHSKGIDCTEADEKADIIDAILAKQDEVDPADPVQAPPPPLPETTLANVGKNIPSTEQPKPKLAQRKLPKGEERVLVTFHETSDPDGKYPIKVTINGDLAVIKRGKPVRVKVKHLKGIDDAIQTHYERDEVSGSVIERKIPRFPYTIHFEK